MPEASTSYTKELFAQTLTDELLTLSLREMPATLLREHISGVCMRDLVVGVLIVSNSNICSNVKHFIEWQ